MLIEEAIKHAIDREAILFLGAGFSIGGINSQGRSMTTGAGLAHILCDDMGIKHSDNLTITSSRYLEDELYKKGLVNLITLLKKELICTQTTKEQTTIVSLPWKRIYTTNYDDIVEVASEAIGFSRNSITITAKRYDSQQNLEQAIVHINGYIRGLNEKKFIEEFKITDDNYNRDGLLKSSWSNMFESDLIRNKAIVFIGYSLDYDQEIVKLIANLNIKDKCIFIDIDNIDDDKEFRLNKYGKLYKFGANGLANEIEKIETSYIPQVKKVETISFKEKNESLFYSDVKYSILDVVNLLVKGKIRTEFINQEGYCLHRKNKINEIKDIFKEKNVTIVQSKLGNGKSIFLECLANEMSNLYDVYHVESIDNYIEDMQVILNRSTKTVLLLIDDYGYYMRLLIELGKDFPDNLKLVLTCRTTINANLYYDLIDKYNYTENQIGIVDLDILENSEIYELVNILNVNRFWGDMDRFSPTDKKKIIKKKYGGNLSKIFYLLLNSEVINEQINRLLETIIEKEQFKKFFLCQSVNSLCGLKITYSDICKFMNISETSIASYRLDANIREVIDFENNKFSISSSIFSQYLIKQGQFNRDIMEILEQLYINCSENDEYLNKYKEQRKILISRSNIKLAFSTNNTLNQEEEKRIFAYYDNIKNLPTASNNPFFWLQFGITALNLEEYPWARNCFDNAYANAEMLENFDAYQLDTHYARLLLCYEMTINSNKKEDAMNNFYMAHKYLTNNSNKGSKLIYVLKQTSLYLDYYNKYKNIFDENDIENFRIKALELLPKYSEYFTLKDMFKIPNEIMSSYRYFRRIFEGTIYRVYFNKVDDEYNKKVSSSNLAVRYLN